MLIFNVLLTVICIWIAMFLNYTFLRVARINNVRFKLFDLRDKLAILAMKGTLDHESLEYSTLIDLLNRSVMVLDKFSVVTFMKFLVTFQRDKELQRRVDKIMSNLGHKDSNYRKIVHNYFAIMHRMLDKHTQILKWALIPFLLFILFPIKVWQKKVQDKSKLINDIDSNLEQRIQQAA